MNARRLMLSGQDNRESGGETLHKTRKTGEKISCPVCNGTGLPDPNVRNLFGPPDTTCYQCKGAKMADKWETYTEVAPWPVFQANPKGKPWHVESNGAIVASGVGVFTVGEKFGEEPQRAKAFVDRIEAVIAKLTSKPSGKAPTQTDAPRGDVTIQSGKPGHLEIRFAAKPSEEIRAALKAAGYRWLGREGLWYGSEAKLPAILQPAMAV